MDYKLTPELVNKIIKEIEMEENLRRKRIAWDSDQIKNGNLKQYVEKRIQQMYPKTWKMYTVTDYSILKKIVDKKSKAYNEAPIRRVQGENAATEIYQDICKRNNLNGAMKTFDEINNQHKHALMACFMDRTQGPVASSQLYWKFYALAPYEYDVVRDNDGKVRVVVLSYPSNYVTTRGMSDQYNALIAESGNYDEGSERFYSFWTDVEHIMVRVTGSSGKKSSLKIEFMPPTPEADGTNPYGILPFVYAPLDYENNYPIPSPLPMQTVELNALMSVYLTSANMQVGVLKITRPEKQKLTISSHSLYTAIEAPQSSRPEDGPTNVEFISPQPNMAGHKEAIQTYLTTILDEQGINGSQVINGTQEFNSGLDRLLAQADTQQIIEENQNIYSKAEEEIYKVVAQQMASVGQNVLPADGFTVIYRKPKVMISDNEKLQNLKTMKELGLWADYELVQMYDPNLSIDEAKQKILDIQTSRVEMATMFTDPTKVFNGAQVSSIVEVASRVASGELERTSGVNILITSFGVNKEQAELMIPTEGSSQNGNQPG
jgi:hypothetical protein